MVKLLHMKTQNALYTYRCAYFLRYGRDFEQESTQPLLSWADVSKLVCVPLERLKWWHRKFQAEPAPEKPISLRKSKDGDYIYPVLTMKTISLE